MRRPNTTFQPILLCGPKIEPILTRGFGSILVLTAGSGRGP